VDSGLVRKVRKSFLQRIIENKKGYTPKKKKKKRSTKKLTYVLTIQNKALHSPGGHLWVGGDGAKNATFGMCQPNSQGWERGGWPKKKKKTTKKKKKKKKPQELSVSRNLQSEN